MKPPLLCCIFLVSIAEVRFLGCMNVHEPPTLLRFSLKSHLLPVDHSHTVLTPSQSLAHLPFPHFPAPEGTARVADRQTSDSDTGRWLMTSKGILVGGRSSYSNAIVNARVSLLSTSHPARPFSRRSRAPLREVRLSCRKTPFASTTRILLGWFLQEHACSRRARRRSVAQDVPHSTQSLAIYIGSLSDFDIRGNMRSSRCVSLSRILGQSSTLRDRTGAHPARLITLQRMT